MFSRRTNQNSKLKILLFILFSFFFILFAWYLININKAVDSNDTEELSFIIKSGQSVKEISANLKEKNLIGSDLAFNLYTRFNNLDKEIKSGVFKLSKADDIKKIAYTFTDIKNGQYVLTIPEGYTINQVDQMLVNEGFIQENEYIACTKNCDFSNFSFLNGASSLEGYLFPDTYFVNPGLFDIKEFIDLQLSTFEKKALPLYEESNTNKSLDEIIIMASIIEREVRTNADLAIVSGILWKRLESEWMLGADATLLYGKDDLHISAEDLEENSPYNTRKFRGLPPTSISNPGIKSINASLNPQSSEYWFYLTTLDTGEVIYSRSNEEHNMNKEKYL